MWSNTSWRSDVFEVFCTESSNTRLGLSLQKAVCGVKREPAAYLKTQDKENNGEARVLQSDSADAVFKFQRDFVNMTWGPLSPTHFLSHDIMGWYWQAPSSCVMLWDFTGSQRRLNTNAALTVAPYVSDSKQLRNHPTNPHQWKKKKKRNIPMRQTAVGLSCELHWPWNQRVTTKHFNCVREIQT